MTDDELRALDDEALDEAIERADKARLEWRADRRRPFREDAIARWEQARLDAAAALRQQCLDGLRAVSAGGAIGALRGAADLAAVAFDEHLDATMRSVILGAEGSSSAGATYHALTKSQWEARMADLTAEVAALEAERTIRSLERVRADTDARLAALRGG